MNCTQHGSLSENRGIIAIGISPTYIKNTLNKRLLDESTITFLDYANLRVKTRLLYSYEIYIDQNFADGLNIIINVLNILIPLDCTIKVKVLQNASLGMPVNHSLTYLLKKLQNHNFVEFEALEINNSSIENASARTSNNVCFFVGPGNTGKSSIVTSTIKTFIKNNKKVALIDLSKNHKFNNYFTSYAYINSDSLKQYQYSSIKDNDSFNLYNYTFSNENKPSNIIILCDFITNLSNIYDHVIITADEKAVAKITNVFKLASKIFFVLDQDRTKISKTKCMVMKLMLNGIKTKKVVALIYNNTKKAKSDMRYIEEKSFFVSFPKRKLISTIDIHCNTIEIPYVRQLPNISKLGTSHFHPKYVKSIEKIYFYINDIPYIEEDEKDLLLLTKEKMKNLGKKINLEKVLIDISDFFKSIYKAKPN